MAFTLIYNPFTRTFDYTLDSSGLLVSPLTTKGDLWSYGTGDARLPVGLDHDILTADSAEATGLKYTKTLEANRKIGTPVTAATYTFAVTDANDYIDISNATGVAVTVPDNAAVAFDIGVEIEGRNSGVGDVTFSPAVGVTINADRLVVSEGGYWALKKVGTDEWVLAMSSPEGRLLGADVTGATYTFGIDDANKYIDIGNAAGVAVTVPDNAAVAFPVTTEIEGRNSGAGVLTFSPAGGVTINNTGLTVSPGGAWALKKVDTDEWDFVSSGVTGDITESTSSVLTITGGTDAVNGSGTSIEVFKSDASTDGYLSSADWNTFNDKQAALTNGVDALTSGEVTQLAAIDTVTISNTQWGYLGASDQGIATTDAPTFAGATLNGGVGYKVTEIDATTYTIEITDSTIAVDHTDTASVTLTLPSAATAFSGGVGNRFLIKDSGANAGTNPITVNRSGADTIITSATGQTSISISSDGEAIWIQAKDSTTWIVF